jgi:hypothetical protein
VLCCAALVLCCDRGRGQEVSLGGGGGGAGPGRGRPAGGGPGTAPCGHGFDLLEVPVRGCSLEAGSEAPQRPAAVGWG